MFRIGMILFILFFSILSLNVRAWNAEGHRLVAQIAWDNLTLNSRKKYNDYNRALGRSFKALSFVNAGPWLDQLRYGNELWMEKIHYIDLPFTRDNSQFPSIDKVNAVNAITHANEVIKTHTRLNDKGFALRILIHIVADLHQPLHSITEYSKRYPRGDSGGNLYHLATNEVANNLHAYWDRGGGLLKHAKYFTVKELQAKAKELENKYPCHSVDTLTPADWAKESYNLAIEYAYQTPFGKRPSKQYQQKVIAISEKRIAFAGCRLSAIVNQLLQSST